MRDTEREAEAQAREKQAPSLTSPDVGLDPGTLGSYPEPKAEVQLLSHPGLTNYIMFTPRLANQLSWP